LTLPQRESNYVTVNNINIEQKGER
jgi:hypothetical protein